jgi:hypothetical protein
MAEVGRSPRSPDHLTERHGAQDHRQSATGLDVRLHSPTRLILVGG